LLRATGLAQVPDEAPLVALVKALAKELDENPSSTRTQQAYLSALKDVRRVLNGAAGRPRGSAESSSAKSEAKTDEGSASGAVDAAEVVPNDLARFKEKHGIA
jgi:hypothetical protein